MNIKSIQWLYVSTSGSYCSWSHFQSEMSMSNVVYKHRYDFQWLQSYGIRSKHGIWTPVQCSRELLGKAMQPVGELFQEWTMKMKGCAFEPTVNFQYQYNLVSVVEMFLHLGRQCWDWGCLKVQVFLHDVNLMQLDQLERELLLLCQTCPTKHTCFGLFQEIIHLLHILASFSLLQLYFICSNTVISCKSSIFQVCL
jgi:hypothetical protein